MTLDALGPAGLKLRNGTGKWILREAISGLVPPSVLSKPKQGFAVPLDHWFRSALRHRIDALQSEDSCIAQWVDEHAVRRISAEHLNGRRDHQQLIWRLVALDGWMRALTARSLANPPAVHELLRARTGRVAAGSSAGTSSG